MNRQKASPLSEATLWRLYRRLLGEHRLRRQLAGLHPSQAGRGSAIAAALSENLVEGDTLGLAPDDLGTRYLCGMALGPLREASTRSGGRKRNHAGWALAADLDHGLLPASAEEQANLAIGAAMAARLHRSGSLTVLVDRTPPTRRRRAGSREQAWTKAAHSAARLELPLLFLTAAPAPSLPGDARPGPRTKPSTLPAIPVDRMDALALYRVIYESAARARAGGGPTWIECASWPLAEDREEDGACATALALMEQALRARKLFDRQQQRYLQQAIEKEFVAAGWVPRPPG